ncbi:MAG TPA: hypothetical protein VF258_03535, partial [Luteolibacter sp.]
WTARDTRADGPIAGIDVLGNMPVYGSDQQFRRWLVSSNNTQVINAVTFASTGSFTDPVELVSACAAAAATSKPTKAVRADRIAVQGTTALNKGKLAWWVGDENCKGFINPNASAKQQAGASVSNILGNTSSPGAYGMQAVDPDFPSNTAAAANVVTHGQAALATTKDRATTAAWFHDLSPYPRSVLCNVSKGGLRQDLSLFLESPDFNTSYAWPSTVLGTLPTGPKGPNNQISLSDVDEYDVLAWKHLSEWSRLRKNINMNNGRPALKAHDSTLAPNDTTNPKWNSGVMRPAPVPIRSLIFVSVGTKKQAAPSTKLEVRLYTYPVLVLWNPYNVDLVIPRFNVLFGPMSTTFDLTLKNATTGVLTKKSFTWKHATSGGFCGVLPFIEPPQPSLVLKAGETKILTSNTSLPVGNQAGHPLQILPFNYSSTNPGSEWGIGKYGEVQIGLIGDDTDELEVETIIKPFTSTQPATFDIRYEGNGKGNGNYPVFQWAAIMGWRYDPADATATLRSPDRFTGTRKVKVKLGDIEGPTRPPHPFMAMVAKLKTLDEEEVPNKTWAHCIPGHAFQGITNQTGNTPAFLSAFKMTVHGISSFEEALDFLPVGTDQTQSIFGSSDGDGQSVISDIEIPMAPLTSLAQLQHLPQGSIDNIYSSGFHFQNHAIGNSFASSGVPADQIQYSGMPYWLDFFMQGSPYPVQMGGNIKGEMKPKFGPFAFIAWRNNIDRSYVANHLLWDDYFFSSMSDTSGDQLASPSERLALSPQASEFYTQHKPLPNERYRPYFYKEGNKIVTEDLFAGSTLKPDAYKKISGALMVDGGFNINSVSVNAWKTLLASTNRRSMATLDSTGGVAKVQPEGSFIVSHFTMPNGPSANGASGKAAEDLRWIGYRELTEMQIDALAQAIVRQVKKRGPFRSLSEFINRRLGPESDELTRYGALQAALEDPAVDINADYRSKTIDVAHLTANGVAYPNQTAATVGSLYQGAPAYVTQADLLGPIAPVLNARSDTFVIRAYGEATDASGRSTARAWCEAVVQRVPELVDNTDAPTTDITTLKSVNKTFGRRLQLVSFRWLSDQEI